VPAGLDWSDQGELPLEEVRDVFLTLAKTLRAHQLYDAQNPAVQRFGSALREALRKVWESRDEIQLLVQEDRFLWLGEEVYRNPNRADSLSFTFYRDGIRDLTFSRGIEDEVHLLLDALQRARNRREEGGDLVTLLWDLDLRHVQHSAVELGGEALDAVALDGPAASPGVGEAARALRDEAARDAADAAAEENEEGEAGGAGAGVVRAEDFNPTLYAFDEEEKRRIQVAVRKEMDRDLRTDMVHALLDVLEDSSRPQRQVDIVEILRTMLPNFLSRGAVLPAAIVVGEVREIAGTRGVLGPEAATAVEGLVADLSSPDVVGEILRALHEGSVRSDARELGELLRALGPAALEGLVRGAESTPSDSVRNVLRDAMQGIAAAHREAVVRLLDSPDPRIVLGALRLAGQIKMDEAAGPLAALMDRASPEICLAAVEVAQQLRSPVVAGALLRLLRHESRDLRIAAARALAGTGYPPAARELKKVLEGKELKSADVSEKVAFFEAYGRLGGEEAVTYLDSVLNGKGFLGRREPSEVRAGAALGLGKVGTPSARSSLETARADDDPVVRSAVGRALRGEPAAHG
jgi:HEAT repeat protein